jgi:hypothetical protein
MCHVLPQRLGARRYRFKAQFSFAWRRHWCGGAGGPACGVVLSFFLPTFRVFVKMSRKMFSKKRKGFEEILHSAHTGTAYLAYSSRPWIYLHKVPFFNGCTLFRPKKHTTRSPPLWSTQPLVLVSKPSLIWMYRCNWAILVCPSNTCLRV